MHKVNNHLMIVVIVLLFMLLPACSKADIRSTEASSFEFEFGFIEEADNQTALTYEGDNGLTLDLYIKNGSEARSVGILVFLDGIIQEYSLDGKIINEMNIIKMDKYSQKVLNVSINPSCGSKIKKSSLRICAVLNPDFVLKDETELYGDNLYVMQLLPRDVEFLVDIGEASKDEVVISDVVDNLESHSHLYLSCNERNKIVRVSMSDPVSLNFGGSFEMGGKYKLYLILNGNISAVFNGQKSANIEIADSGGFDYCVTIENDDLHTENSIIVLAIPVEFNDSMVLRSNPICILKE